MSAETIWGVVGTVLGVVGIVTGYIFYRLGLKKKEPCWAIRSANLIEGYSKKFDELMILYANHQVENLTVSKILFWNNGTETIQRNDIDTVNHLRIIGTEGLKFLDTKILAQNNESNRINVNITDSGDIIYLDFDYIDHKNGCVIQVVHTGISSKDLNIVGDIKGVRLMRNKSAGLIPFNIMNAPNRYFKRHTKLISLLAIIIGLTYLGFGFAIQFLESIKQIFKSSETTDFYGSIFLSVISIIGGLLILFMGIRLWKRSGMIPEGLEVFRSEWF
ncbi:MAG: hypothetical protein A2W33_04585 [Chloroflexi bacterium RBG_16_52_11]|nr:MAG: hypothetical protein A2W33_04585 [Chloroflexi bacterium RBG_16_52_11]